MMSTIKVVIHTSFQVGQVTFATSCRTSCIKVMGLNFAIKTAFRAHNVTTCRTRPRSFTGSVGRSNRHEAGRGGGSRTPDLRFWRPTLYQLSYTPKRDTSENPSGEQPLSGRAPLTDVDLVSPARWLFSQRTVRGAVQGPSGASLDVSPEPAIGSMTTAEP